MKSLKEKCTLLGDKKSAIFFKVSDTIVELGGPSMIQDSMLILIYDLEVEVSKFKDKWLKEFDNLSDFSEDNIRMRTIDYVNLNNNITIIICESCYELIEIKNEIFEMKIK